MRDDGRPVSGSVAYPLTVVIRQSEGQLVDLDASPAIAVVNSVGTSRADHLSSVTHASTGVYKAVYTVQSTDADEGLSFTATGTVGSVALCATPAPRSKTPNR